MCLGDRKGDLRAKLSECGYCICYEKKYDGKGMYEMLDPSLSPILYWGEVHAISKSFKSEQVNGFDTC